MQMNNIKQNYNITINIFFTCMYDDLPSLLGSQPLTVRALSTSTKTRRPSIFLPSACLYAAARNR